LLTIRRDHLSPQTEIDAEKFSKKIARDPIRASTHPDVWICLHDLFDAGERQRWVLAVVGGVVLCCRDLALPKADKEVVERIAMSDKRGRAGRRGRRGQKGLWLLLRRIRRHCDREGSADDESEAGQGASFDHHLVPSAVGNALRGQLYDRGDIIRYEDGQYTHIICTHTAIARLRCRRRHIGLTFVLLVPHFCN
jgi:hypothetical protein